MSLRKKLLVAAAVSALTAVTAIPAMALENEFHGMMAVRGTNTNYLTGGGTGILNPAADSRVTNNYVEQRTRIFYSAKANDNLKLVTGFEIDSTWGKSAYIVGRANEGGALGADSVNLETKWAYLDFNEPITGANFKAGIQGLNDAYKGLVVGGGADAGGVLVSKAFGPLTTTAGWFRLDDRTAFAAPTSATGGAVSSVLPTGPTFSNGKATRDFFILDGKFAVSKDIKVGGSYYFFNADKSASAITNANIPSTAVAAPDYNVHMVGVNAAANVGPVAVDGFAIYQFGSNDTGAVAYRHVNAFAANAAAKVKAGPGTAKVSALYVSGGASNGFFSVNNQNSSALSENVSSSMGNLFLLVRNPQYTTNDQYMVYESSNQGQGIIGGSVGYDLSVTDKLYTNVNAGFLAVAKRPVTGITASPKSDSSYQGTEINAEVGYKMYDGLTAAVQGAYVFLGDYYKGTGTGASDPANPYVGRIILSYVF